MDFEKAIVIQESDIKRFLQEFIDDFVYETKGVVVFEDEEELEEEFLRFFDSEFSRLLSEEGVDCVVVFYGKVSWQCYSVEDFLDVFRRTGVDWRRMLSQAVMGESFVRRLKSRKFYRI